MVDAADHAWTIAIAQPAHPCPPTARPCATAGAARTWRPATCLWRYTSTTVTSIPQPSALQAAAPPPEAWADTVPEEIAAYLQITVRRFNTALGRLKGTPYPLNALLYPAQPPHLPQLKLSEG